MAKLEDVKGFHSTFRSFGNGGCVPQAWERHFLSYDVNEWTSEGDGVLQFFGDDKKRYSLTIVHVPNRGFVLQYDCRSLEENKTLSCKYAVSDLAGLSHLEEVEDGLQYPTACILEPATAWIAVRDFFNKPTQPSDQVNWVSDEDIPWPEQ